MAPVFFILLVHTGEAKTTTGSAGPDTGSAVLRIGDFYGDFSTST
jgi:hypothetical protein